MSGVNKTMLGKKIAGALTAVGLVLAPVALYADASAPWVNKPRVMKKKATKVVRKRKQAVRSMRHAPRKYVARAMPRAVEPAPEMPAANVEPTYTPPVEPAYTPPAVPEAPPAAVAVPEPVAPAVTAPTVSAPVAAAPAASGGGFPILAVLGALAAIGGIVAVASGGSDSP